MYYNYQTAKPNKEAFTRTCSVKKVFLKISQTLEENTCSRVSFSIKFFIKKGNSGTGVFLWILPNF